VKNRGILLGERSAFRTFHQIKRLVFNGAELVDLDKDAGHSEKTKIRLAGPFISNF